MRHQKPDRSRLAFLGCRHSTTVSYSKSHNKAKGSRSARPRFHVVFPVTTITDAKQYENLKTEIDGLYVGDASVIPISPGKPPILLILALAERLANHLIEEVL